MIAKERYPKTRAAFRYSFWILIISIMLMAATFLPGMGEVLENPRLHGLVQVFGGIIGVCAAIAASFFWIGMLIHCLITRKLKQFPKLLWLVALLFANIVAAVCYYFVIYCASPKFQPGKKVREI